ncbi:DUF2937 family protein [bacterium]|nr:DUF2937 family protein [bacterium]
MIIRALALAAGLAGAAGFSQFPEFTQQYVQRLGGAVDELARSVEAFDGDAAALGLDREAALAQLATGGAFGAARAETMRETLTRHARLSGDLAALEGKSALSRVPLVAHFADPEIAERTWQAYRPGVPMTAEGAIFAGSGFVSGWLAVAFLLSLLSLPFRRRPRGRGRRVEPVLHRPTQAPRGHGLRAVRGAAPARAGARLPRDI